VGSPTATEFVAVEFVGVGFFDGMGFDGMDGVCGAGRSATS